ncbi:MAG: hypothetical protein AAFO01_11720 [Pseudomonadota bacterium]
MSQLIDIENLVIWAFQAECASLQDEGLDITAGYPEDSIVRCHRADVLGGFITGTSPGARVLASPSHPDAVAVTDAMARLEPGVAKLIASHGKAASRPDWMPDARFRFEPRSWDWDEASGEPYGLSEICPLPENETKWQAWVYCPTSRRTIRAPKPRWTPVVTKDSPSIIRTARRSYLDWWDGLHELGVSLAGCLADWRLYDIMPEREPWLKVSQAA